MKKPHHAAVTLSYNIQLNTPPRYQSEVFKILTSLVSGLCLCPEIKFYDNIVSTQFIHMYNTSLHLL